MLSFEEFKEQVRADLGTQYNYGMETRFKKYEFDKPAVVYEFANNGPQYGYKFDGNELWVYEGKGESFGLSMGQGTSLKEAKEHMIHLL